MHLGVVVVLLGFGAVAYALYRIPSKGRYMYNTLFPVLYFLYTKTRLGYWLHLHLLRKSAGSLHSITQPLILDGVEIVPIAIVEDNYAYVVIDTASRKAVVVDPSDPHAVKDCIDAHHVSLKAVLTTHKHWDHSGGNQALKSMFPGLLVYGSARDQVPYVTNNLQDRDTVKIGSLEFEALLTPGHTAGHTVFLLKTVPPCLFTGDHIFIGGNGKLFECAASTMVKSIDLVKDMDASTLIFPGHEYTLDNMVFAGALEPFNIHVQNKLKLVKQQRTKKLSTVPSILSDELLYNPFMRTSSGVLKTALGVSLQSSPSEVLLELRKQKNAFRS